MDWAPSAVGALLGVRSSMDASWGDVEHGCHRTRTGLVSGDDGLCGVERSPDHDDLEPRVADLDRWLLSPRADRRHERQHDAVACRRWLRGPGRGLYLLCDGLDRRR